VLSVRQLQWRKTTNAPRLVEVDVASP